MSLHDNTKTAMRLAFGKHCAGGSYETLFNSLTPKQLYLVHAWRIIIEHDETIGVDDSDIYRGKATFDIGRKVQVPALLAGLMTFMSDYRWDFPREILDVYLGEEENEEDEVDYEVEEEEEEEEEGEQLYYCYSLRSREKRTSTGELMYGYSWDGDYVTTFCYGREQLKKYLTADMKVVRVAMSHNCKPRHALP